MFVDLFPAVVLILFWGIAGIFILIWPILIWSHLREQSRYLAEIRDLLAKEIRR